MPTLAVSSKGQIVLPAAIRRRLGLGAGSRLEVIEQSDGIHLRVEHAMPSKDVSALAGMLKAPSKGKPRNLLDFDVATLAKPLPGPRR